MGKFFNRPKLLFGSRQIKSVTKAKRNQTGYSTLQPRASANSPPRNLEEALQTKSIHKPTNSREKKKNFANSREKSTNMRESELGRYELAKELQEIQPASAMQGQK